MRTLKILPLAAALFLLAVAAGGARPAGLLTSRAQAQDAEAPTALVPYSGQLTDAGGQPVPDNAYAFRLELYDTEDGGQPLWAETQEQVPVYGGAFSVMLGEQTPLPAALMEGGARWLALAVRGPDEAEFTALAPRQALMAVQSATTTAPAAGPACAHDHVGEWWDVGTIDSVARSGFGLEGTVKGGINASAVIHVRNLSTSGGSAIIADHLGNGPGLFAHSNKGAGVYAWSKEKQGVYATSAKTHAVYG